MQKRRLLIALEILDNELSIILLIMIVKGWKLYIWKWFLCWLSWYIFCAGSHRKEEGIEDFILIYSIILSYESSRKTLFWSVKISKKLTMGIRISWGIKLVIWDNLIRINKALMCCYSPYNVVWQIPKLIVKACTISLNTLNYISVFCLIVFNVFWKLHGV